MERRRPYDTSEPNSLGEVLSQLFAKKGYGRVQANRQLQEAWKDVVGEDAIVFSKVTGIKNGVMQVSVSNSALLSELASFRRLELLDALSDRHAHLKVKDIRFKLRGKMD